MDLIRFRQPGKEISTKISKKKKPIDICVSDSTPMFWLK